MRGGGHEILRRLVQRVALLAIVHVGVKNLDAPLGQELAAMAELLIRDVAVVAMPGELEALPEIHDIDQVLDRVLRPDEAEIDQPFAPEQVEARQSPAH